MKVNSFINYLLVAYYILWDAINSVFFLGDGMGRIGLILGLFSFTSIITTSGFNVFKEKSILIWLLWVFYAIIGWLSFGINVTSHEMGVEVPKLYFCMARFISPLLVMIVSVYEIVCNSKKFILFSLVLFVVYMLLGLQTIQSSGDQRLLSQLGNNLPLACVTLIMIALFIDLKKWLNKKLLIIIVILGLYCIIVAATRKAFVGSLIIIAFWIIAKHDLLKTRNIILLALLLSIGYFVVTFVLENTALGERFAKTTDDGAEFNETNYTWLNFLGDRAGQYVTGWSLFLKYPIFGIGYSNFPVLTNQHYPIHSEIMVHICEGGIIGLLLFISFIASLFMKIKKMLNFNSYYKYSLLFLGYLLSVLLIDLTAWTYDTVPFFVGFGIIIGSYMVSHNLSFK